MEHPNLHRYQPDTAFPYSTFTSPSNEQWVWVAGSNLLTSRQGYVERRPGFASDTSTGLNGVIDRIFCWRVWGGAFYKMVSTATSLYKFKIGTDTNYADVLSSPQAGPWDMATANNNVFAGSASFYPIRYDGTNAYNWGFRSTDIGGVATTFSLGAGALNATVGYYYLYCPYNSTTGHYGPISPISASTGTFTGKNITVNCTNGVATVSGVTGLNTGADKIALFRTTDGGSSLGPFYLVTNAIVNTGTLTPWTYTDSTSDANLGSTVAPLSGSNNAPPQYMIGVVSHAGRLWGYVNATVYFSGQEEISAGVPEECFPVNNTFKFPDEVTGLAAVGGAADAALLVFTANAVYKITGDSLDSFQRSRLFKGIGCRNRAAIAAIGKSVAWLDSHNKVRITDGHSQQEISQDINSDISSITHANASLCFHADNDREWLLLSDRTKVWVLDMQVDAATGRPRAMWMPPWSPLLVAMHSGETSSGAFELLAGTTTAATVVKMTPSTYVDGAATTYTAYGTVDCISLGADMKAGDAATPIYVSLERNNIALGSVKYLLDDDPALQSTLVTITTGTHKTTPPYRTNGTYLVEELWYLNEAGAPARRMAVRIDWAAASTNFKLFSIDYASREFNKR